MDHIVHIIEEYMRYKDVCSDLKIQPKLFLAWYNRNEVVL